MLTWDILFTAVDCKNPDQSKCWLKTRHDVWNGCAKRELFCEIWTLLGKRRQPTDGGENTPFRLSFPPLSGKTTSLQDYIKTITLAEEKLKGVLWGWLWFWLWEESWEEIFTNVWYRLVNYIPPFVGTENQPCKTVWKGRYNLVCSNADCNCSLLVKFWFILVLDSCERDFYSFIHIDVPWERSAKNVVLVSPGFSARSKKGFWQHLYHDLTTPIGRHAYSRMYFWSPLSFCH